MWSAECGRVGVAGVVWTAKYAWLAWSLTGRTRTCRLALLTGTAGSPPRRRPFVFYPQSICGKTVLTHVVYKSSFFALNPASPAANQGPLHEAGHAQTPQPRGLPCAAPAPAFTPVTQPSVPVSPLRRAEARGHPRLGSRLPGSHLYRFTKCFPTDRAPECRSRMDAWKKCGEARVRPARDTGPGARGEPRLLDTHTPGQEALPSGAGPGAQVGTHQTKLLLQCSEAFHRGGPPRVPADCCC